MESLLFKRQGEIDALRERQSREMDKAVRSNLEHLTALVEQHVGEIELKEDAWRKSIQLEMAYASCCCCRCRYRCRWRRCY